MQARLLLALVIVSLALSCSRRPDQAAGTVTITFWHSFVASTIPALDDLLREFERTHPSIRINAQYVPTGDALVQKLVAAVRSGTAPDISWIHADFIDKLVEADALLPLDSLIAGPDSLSGPDMADIYPALVEAGMLRGVHYALPMEATSLALLYNRDLFRKAGLDPGRPPRDWGELREYAARLTSAPDAQGRREQYGFYVPVFPASGELNVWMNLQWVPFLWQAGGDELSADRRTCTFDSPPGVSALSLWKSIYEAEQFDRFAVAHDLGFAAGRLAMILDGPWNLPRYRAMKNVDWAVAPLPAGAAGRATYLAGEQLAIFRQSAHPAEAWTFIRWVVGREAQARFSVSSGYLPVRRSVLEMPEYRKFLASDPAIRAYVDQMSVGRGRQVMERHRVEVNRYLAEAIERSLVGREDPALCLREAARKSNAILRGETSALPR